MFWWVWILLGFALALLELATPGGFYFIFFGISAFIVGILSAADLTTTAWFEWLLFSVLSIVATAVCRAPLLKRFGPSVPHGDVDSLIGQSAVVMEKIKPNGIGKVELRGSSWNALNTGNDLLSPGARCRVESVEGLTLYVRTVE